MVWTAPHPAISLTQASMENHSTVYVGVDVHVPPESCLSFCFTEKSMT
jgi:hypothetical protein